MKIHVALDLVMDAGKKEVLTETSQLTVLKDCFISPFV